MGEERVGGAGAGIEDDPTRSGGGGKEWNGVVFGVGEVEKGRSRERERKKGCLDGGWLVVSTKRSLLCPPSPLLLPPLLLTYSLKATTTTARSRGHVS